MGRILEILFGAIAGGIADAFAAWRRDRALERLGYAEAERDIAKTDAAIRRRMGDVVESSRADTVGRLRAGRF